VALSKGLQGVQAVANKYIPQEEYKPKGLLYQLPIIGDALKDALIPQSVQQSQLAKLNEQKLVNNAIDYGFNDNFLIDARAGGLLGNNYQPIETEGKSFISNLLSVESSEGGKQFTLKNKDFIEALVADFPLLTKTQTVQGTTEDFIPSSVVYNPNKNSVFIVGKNYKGDMAPKTLMQSDATDDEIAEYSLSDANELFKLALNYKYVNSNQKPGYISASLQDAQPSNTSLDIAEAISEAKKNGLLEDAEVVGQFNESIAALIAEQQDPEAAAKLDDEIPPIALTEVRPEIVELLPDQAGPPEPGSKQAQAMAMVEGSQLSEEDTNAMIQAWNNMNTAEKVSLLSTGLLVIPGVGALTYAGVRGIALTAGVLSRANIGTRLLNFAKSTVTRPKTQTQAVSKSGKRFDVDSPQGKQIVKAGEADLKKRSTSEKLMDFGRGKGSQNPRTVTEVVKDSSGNVVREFSPTRATGLGLAGTSIGGNIAGGMIEGELDEIETANEQQAGTEAVAFDVPEFKSAQEATTYFSDENNYNNFVKAASSTGAQNVAERLESALDSLGVTDGQSFTANIDKIVASINPTNDVNTNRIAAALIAERSGASRPDQAKLFYNTLNAFTSSDRLSFDASARQRDLLTETKDSFTSYYLPDTGFDTSGEIQEIQELFAGGSFDELTENNSIKLNRDALAGKYQALFPEYIMTDNGPLNIKRAQLQTAGQRVGLNRTELVQLTNNQRAVENLERIQTSQAVKSLIDKYSRTGLFEAIRNFFAGRVDFKDPEDEIYPYVSAEVRKTETGYDLVRLRLRQPGSGAKSSIVIEDQEFTNEFGNLESQLQLGFYANLGKQNIKVIN